MKQPTEIFEELLVLNAQSGDSKAFALLAKKWNDRVRRQIYWQVKNTEVSKDLTQDCWISISKSLPKLKDPRSFGSWILRIAHNKSIDWVRRNAKVITVDNEETFDALIDDQSSSGSDLVDSLRVAMKDLTEDQRMILRMHYLQGLSIVEIGEVLHISLGTVKSRLFRAREHLKILIKSRYER